MAKKATNFTQQLAEVIQALENDDQNRMNQVLCDFLMIYDPVNNFDEILKYSYALRCSKLLDRSLDAVYKLNPLIFLGVMRILALISGYEEDLYSSAVSTVLDIMQENVDEVEIQISGLKFLANLTQDGVVREAIGQDCIDHVSSLLEHDEHSQNSRIVTVSCLLLANLSIDCKENKETIGIDATPALMNVFRIHYREIKTCQSVIYCVKNLVTNSTHEVIWDLVQHGVIFLLKQAMEQHANDTKVLSSVLDVMLHIFHANESTKKAVSSDVIEAIIKSISSYSSNKDIVITGTIVLLQLAKLRIARQVIGDEGGVTLALILLRAHPDDIDIVDISSKLLERLCVSSVLLPLLQPQNDIPLILQTLTNHPMIESIHFTLSRLLYRLIVEWNFKDTTENGFDFDGGSVDGEKENIREIIKANGGVSVLVNSMNNHEGVTKRWACETMNALFRAPINSDSANSDSGSASGSDEEIEEKSSDSESEGSHSDQSNGVNLQGNEISIPIVEIWEGNLVVPSESTSNEYVEIDLTGSNKNNELSEVIITDPIVTLILGDVENERKEKERKEQMERERIEAEKKEKERLERERIEAEEKEREKQEKERLEREKQEKERLEREKQEKERLERENQEKERLEREKQEKEKKEREEKERQEKERREKERQEKERREKDRQEKERLAKEKHEKEKQEKEKHEKEKQEKERLEREKAAQERQRLDKVAQEKEEQDKHDNIHVPEPQPNQPNHQESRNGTRTFLTRSTSARPEILKRIEIYQKNLPSDTKPTTNEDQQQVVLPEWKKKIIERRKSEAVTPVMASPLNKPQSQSPLSQSPQPKSQSNPSQLERIRSGNMNTRPISLEELPPLNKTSIPTTHNSLSKLSAFEFWKSKDTHN